MLQPHIVVDMSPLEPNGRNGGAGLVATALVHELSELVPHWRFTLLTADDSHAELAHLERQNVRRLCVYQRPPPRRLSRVLVDRVLPTRLRVQVKHVYHAVANRRSKGRVFESLGTDLLLCPFTSSAYWQPRLPRVSIVYDLQHLTYPEFFSPEQRLNRGRHVAEALRNSCRLACISDYVRQTVLATCDVRADRVVTVPLGILREPSKGDPRVVEGLGLQQRPFLLYPANFWPHKNHRRLFEALRIHRSDNPGTELALVCTGAPNELSRALAAETSASDNILFAGYVSEDQLAALLEAAVGLIYPTLYEGFGLPVLEAMAAGTPVICSRVASLPEVGGDAVRYCDPTDAHDIARAIGALQDQPTLLELARRGRARAARWGTARDMAGRYLELIEDVLRHPHAA
jgi:glycosyltransferase involved in cell wall biosynthesis